MVNCLIKSSNSRTVLSNSIWLISQSEKEFIFDRTLFPKSFKTRLKTLFHGLGTGLYLGTRVGTGMSGTEASNKLFFALFILLWYPSNENLRSNIFVLSF